MYWGRSSRYLILAVAAKSCQQKGIDGLHVLGKLFMHHWHGEQCWTTAGGQSQTQGNEPLASVEMDESESSTTSCKRCADDAVKMAMKICAELKQNKSQQLSYCINTRF